DRSSARSFPAAPRREWRDRASRNAAAGKWRAPGRKAGALAPRSKARSGDGSIAAPSWQHHRGDRARAEEEQRQSESAREYAAALGSVSGDHSVSTLRTPIAAWMATATTKAP